MMVDSFDVVAGFLLFDGEPRLLLRDERPDFVNLDVVEVKTPELPIHLGGAFAAEGNH